MKKGNQGGGRQSGRDEDGNRDPYRYAPYQAKDTRGVRYASTNHTYIVWWFSDETHDNQVKVALGQLGFPVKIGTDSTLRIGYKVQFCRRKSSQFQLMLRKILTTAVYNRLDFSIQEVNS